MIVSLEICQLEDNVAHCSSESVYDTLLSNAVIILLDLTYASSSNSLHPFDSTMSFDR